MSDLKDFITAIKQMNTLFSRLATDKEINYADQTRLTEFYQAYRDVPSFEKMILDVMMKTDQHTAGILFQAIKSELRKNISLYESGRNVFDSLDIKAVCRDRARFYDDAIVKQRQKWKEYDLELKEVRASLEALTFDNDPKKKDVLWREEDIVKGYYNEEKKILNELYDLQQQLHIEVSEFQENLFGPIAELSQTFLTVIDGYLPDTVEEKTVEPEPELTPQTAPKDLPQYLSMGLLSEVYELCNEDQFESCHEIEFYRFFNLHPTEHPVRIKSGEKIRVCYLIHCLSEQVIPKIKEEWRTGILEKFGIPENLYKSKYKEPVSDLPSKASEDFHRCLTALLKDFPK